MAESLAQLLAAACGIATTWSDECLQQGVLLRKSFEYGIADKTGQLDSVLASLSLHTSSEPNKLPNSLDAFWSREHMMARVFKAAFEIPYARYLPGRIYTYEIFLDLLLRRINIDSVIDVGCGSGMMLHAASKRGLSVGGIDNSIQALSFAYYLATEFDTRNLTLAHSNALSDHAPRSMRASLVSNLGSLEHLSPADQLIFASYMASMSNGFVAIAIPNHESPLFQTMEHSELNLENQNWAYPEETTQFLVDFDEIASKLSWNIVTTGFFHVAPTSLTSGTPEVESLLRSMPNAPANDRDAGRAIARWLYLERNLEAEKLSHLAWFKFALYSL